MEILIEKLSKRYNYEWIFRNADYKFLSGNTYVIVGPNGSGKSTLLQVLSGMVPPTDGRISYSHRSGAVEPENIFRHLTLAAPYMDLIEEFTLTEMVNFHFSLRRSRGNAGIDEVIKQMRLSHAADKQIINFSSGMKQRLKLGLSFLTESDIILLDEPGSNLDAAAFNWYREQLAALPPDSLVIIASNNPQEYPPSAQLIEIQSFKVKGA